jgi:hypothetical protein
MAAGPRGWQVDDWRGAGRARPVKTFIDNLSKPAKAKVIAALHISRTMAIGCSCHTPVRWGVVSRNYGSRTLRAHFG